MPCEGIEDLPAAATEYDSASAQTSIPRHIAEVNDGAQRRAIYP